MKNIELLAPAGEWECIEAAAYFGADAIYMGGDLLQLRAKRAGFSRERLEQAVNYMHERGKKVYVTVNAFAKNDEIPQCGDYARYLLDIGVDAAIISDPGVLAEFAHAAPGLETHVSTQANCMNYRTAQIYASLGAKRIVLARELDLEQIAELRAKLDPAVSLEAFVHGSMCMAYSGRCLMSSYLTGRSGNRGECTQSCRWQYTLMEKKRPGQYFDMEEWENGTAILSSHDLCCIDMLDELAKAGITSFKIEGRMKSAYYVATAVNAYRCAMDGTLPIDACKKELECLQHRPYATGFYHGELKMGHYNSGEYIADYKFIANVLESADGCLKLRQRNHFAPGDTLEVLSPGRMPVCFTVPSIRDEEGNLLDAARHADQMVFVPCELALKPGDMLRRREG